MRRLRLLWIQAVHHLQRLHFRFRFSPSSTLDRSQSSARDSCLWGFVRFSNRLSVVSSIKTQHLGVHRGPLLSLAMSSTHGSVVHLRDDDVFSIN